MTHTPSLQDQAAALLKQYPFEQVFDMGLIRTPADVDGRIKRARTIYEGITLRATDKPKPDLRFHDGPTILKQDPDSGKPTVFMTLVDDHLYLGERALEALFLHELGHYQKGHAHLHTRAPFRVLDALARVTAPCVALGAAGAWATGHLNTLSMGTALLGSYAAYQAPELAWLYHARKMEYAADAFAAEYQGSSRGMEMVLVRRNVAAQSLRERGAGESILAELEKEDAGWEIFSDHPSNKNRLAALRQWQEQQDKAAATARK